MKSIRIAALSDTHSKHHLITEFPEADVFIHAGDFMNGGMDKMELVDFDFWLARLPYAIKICVAGNHDCLLDPNKFPLSAKTLHSTIFNAATHYLDNEAVKINGFKFYGSPITPEFCSWRWAFNRARGAEIKGYWDAIPDDVDVLITHGPPAGILDTLQQGTYAREHLGCSDLTERIRELDNLKLHIFGHIHGSRGKYIQTLDRGDEAPLIRTSANVSFLDEEYQPHVGPAISVFEVKK